MCAHFFSEPRRAQHARLAGGTAPRKAAGDARAGRPSCLNAKDSCRAAKAAKVVVVTLQAALEAAS